MNNNAVLKKVWNVFSTVIVVLVVIMAVFLMGSRLVGFKVFTVISGSMEPKYSVGDLIYVQKVEPEQIKVGDPITFVVNEDLVVATHQVIKIDAENKHFYTQGLANDTPDASPVHFNNLIGRPLFSIPYLGYVSDWIQNPPGLQITVVLGILLVLALFLPDVKKKPKAERVQDDQLERMRAELEVVKAELEAQKAKQTQAVENADVAEKSDVSEKDCSEQ